MRVKKWMLVPLIIAVGSAAIVITHTSSGQPQSHVAASTPRPSAQKIATTMAPTPIPADSPTATPVVKMGSTSSSTPTASPSVPPTPTATKAMMMAMPSNCASLQNSWSLSLAQTVVNQRWQLDQGLLSMLLSTTQRNSKIDAYNTAVQGAYTALGAQAKSAQCSLGLSAPAVYPHVR